MTTPTPDELAQVRRQQLYYDDSFSDVTVCFGEKKFRAHKAILSVCSEYFFRLFTGSFKEASSKEITLLEDDEEAMEGMFKHMYGLEASYGDAFLDIKLLIVADKYDVLSLSNISQENLEHEMHHWSSDHRWHFAELAREIYVTPACTQKLRRIAVDTFKEEVATWLAVSNFRMLLLDIPQVGIDLLDAVMDTETYRDGQ